MQRVGAGRAREVVEAQAQYHSPADSPRGTHPPGDPVDKADKGRVDVLERLGRTAESPLRADRASAPPRLHGARVAVVRERVELSTRNAAEQRDERRLGERRDLANGPDPEPVELPRRHPAHAPEPLDRERVQERELAARRHDEEAVGLGDPARHLGKELRPGDADRDREPDALAHLGAQTGGDLGRRAREPPDPAHVEERLVDRQPLDERRGVLEDLEDRLARLDVRRHAGLDDDRVRAEPAGAGDAHRGAHAARLRLVAGREHHPVTDDHRPSTQTRIVSLLNGSEECVDVGVRDGRVSCHERMFSFSP